VYKLREKEGEVVELKIIFEDECLVVIDKPSGIVSNNAESVKEETVQSWFFDKILNPKSENPNKSQNLNTNNLELSTLNSEFWSKGGVVHRLDKDTSGVMVLAKTEEAYEALKSQFLERKTVKKYVALVHGELKEARGLINTPIERIGKKFYVGTDLSRTAITEWQVIKAFSVQGSAFSLLELTPHTGRTHQLRVHMRHLGHPMVADPIYGDRKTWKKDLQICPRLFLHAKYLEFTHPVSKQRVNFEAELPEDLAKVIH